MKNILRMTAVLLLLTMICPAALAASKATPTPPPGVIDAVLVEPPAEIQRALDLAYADWQEVNGNG